jgi:hypothetical protein
VVAVAGPCEQRIDFARMEGLTGADLVTRYTYNDQGHRVGEEVIESFDDGLEMNRTSFTYDDDGRLLLREHTYAHAVRSYGSQVQYRYEGALLVEEVTTEAGGDGRWRTERDYDAQGRLVELREMIRTDGRVGVRHWYRYDGDGAEPSVALTDNLGGRDAAFIEEYRYDELGRRVLRERRRVSPPELVGVERTVWEGDRKVREEDLDRETRAVTWERRFEHRPTGELRQVETRLARTGEVTERTRYTFDCWP